MRGPRSFAMPALAALALIAVAACGPGTPASPTPAASSAVPATAPAPSSTTGSAATAAPSMDLVTSKLPLQPISLGVPAGWVVLDYERLVALIEQLRPIEPELARSYEFGAIEGIRAVDFTGLPDAFRSLDASFACDDATTAEALLERLRPVVDVNDFEASIVDLPAGKVARVSFLRSLETFTLRYSVYAFLAPMTDCDGALTLVVTESDPAPGLAEAIARTVTIDSGQGVVTLQLGDTVVLPPTDFRVTCEVGGETGDELRMSSGTAVPEMMMDLAVDTSGQPTFFQFANGTYAYFAGKGFDAREAFTPEAGSTQTRGAATFEGITPPDDPAHPLSGRVTWACSV